MLYVTHVWMAGIEGVICDKLLSEMHVISECQVSKNLLVIVSNR